MAATEAICAADTAAWIVDFGEAFAERVVGEKRPVSGRSGTRWCSDFESVPDCSRVPAGGFIAQLQSGRLVALDVDQPERAATFDIDAGEFASTTPVVRTPSGGYHIYFDLGRWDDLLRFKNAPLTIDGERVGVDVRHVGGNLVLPCSRGSSPGTRYEWLEGSSPFDLCVAQLPARLLTVLPRRVDHDRPEAERTEFEPSETTSRYGTGALRSAASRVMEAAVGERNITLNAQAFALYELVAGGEIAERDVEEAMALACEINGLIPGKRSVAGNAAEMRSFKATLKSARRGGLRNPRRAPATGWGHDPVDLAIAIDRWAQSATFDPLTDRCRLRRLLAWAIEHETDLVTLGERRLAELIGTSGKTSREFVARLERRGVLSRRSDPNRGAADTLALIAEDDRKAEHDQEYLPPIPVHDATVYGGVPPTTLDAWQTLLVAGRPMSLAELHQASKTRYPAKRFVQRVLRGKDTGRTATAEAAPLLIDEIEGALFVAVESPDWDLIARIVGTAGVLERRKRRHDRERRAWADHRGVELIDGREVDLLTGELVTDFRVRTRTATEPETGEQVEVDG